MNDEPTLARARQAFTQKAWADAYRLFTSADRDGELTAEDLELLAVTAHLAGREVESDAGWTRAHQQFLERDDREGAARCAAWLANGLLQRGARAPAQGWLTRAARILDEAQLDSVVRGYLLIPSAIQRVVQGDPAAGLTTFTEAGEIARRFGDRGLASLACVGRGRALIRLGRVPEGVALLDESMVAVVAGDVTATLAGDIYCTVLEGCQETFDIRRAYEWTTSLAQWCAGQTGLVRYRGECLLYRAEILQLHGKWQTAAQDAQTALELLVNRPAAGAAFYRLGEIHRLRGELSQADVAYTRANEHGRKPHPGVSLLRLAQGEVDTAAASIRSVLLDTRTQAARARILTAAVDILLAAGDVANARTAAEELSAIARAIGARLLGAAAAQATGAVLLAEGDHAGAAAVLADASETWRDLEMPYEEAHTCLLMAAICERRGDHDGHRLEVAHARRLFTDLNAGTGPAPIPQPGTERMQPPSAPLSERETQVLCLLAAGQTNREIAERLFISEKTVARHVSNIFDKLGVSTRTRAAAWAHHHDLV